MLSLLTGRITGRYQRASAELFARRPLTLANQRPLISFTFDDFPRSALFNAGTILEQHGARGTYYVSLGLENQVGPTGELFHVADLPILLQRGHELGCHTFAHCHAWDTSPKEFERSILQNASALQSLVPGLEFRTLSFPIGSPRPETKRRSGKHFSTCRGGGQTYNIGTVDLNRLNAFFLEQSLAKPSAIEELIDRNARECGWLIFATHDVCDNPTRFGCRPEFFERVARSASRSGAELLTISQAYDRLTLAVSFCEAPMGSS